MAPSGWGHQMGEGEVRAEGRGRKLSELGEGKIRTVGFIDLRGWGELAQGNNLVPELAGGPGLTVLRVAAINPFIKFQATDSVLGGQGLTIRDGG